MEAMLFSGATRLEFQGEDLMCLGKVDDHVEYRVVGFDFPQILVEDYRPSAEAIRKLATKKRADRFAQAFNTSASIKIYLDVDGDYRVELYETSDPAPEHVLWFTSGPGEWFPAYNYFLYEFSSSDEGKVFFFALYKRPGVSYPWSAPVDADTALLSW